MEVTPFGISKWVKFSQSKNALPSIVLMLSDNLIDVNSVQPEKELLPREVTEFGISIELKPVQPLNALGPMVVI